MICPHCARTIREEQQYLMSADPDAERPWWAVPAVAILVGLVLGAVIAAAHGAI